MQMKLFLHQCIQKLRRFLAIFAVQSIHLVWGEFVFAPTALYIAHLLAIHCHSVSLGKLYNFSIVLFERYGKFCCSPVHFYIRRICLCSNCTVHRSFVKVHCDSIPWVSYTNKTCWLFLFHFVWKLGWFLLLTCTFCQRKNLCSLQLLHTSFIW